MRSPPVLRQDISGQLVCEALRGGRTACFVFKAEDITIIGCLERAFVVILRALEHLGERSEVDTEGNWTVAAVERETVGVQFDGDESDVGVIHRLQVLQHVRSCTSEPKHKIA